VQLGWKFTLVDTRQHSRIASETFFCFWGFLCSVHAEKRTLDKNEVAKICSRVLRARADDFVTFITPMTQRGDNIRERVQRGNEDGGTGPTIERWGNHIPVVRRWASPAQEANRELAALTVRSN
jgi:hypothetical protein